ncbi:MAG TPA: hypothetical protein VHV77_10385, partial [Pirellulales bacterium]|nr:hypothetical protein [Pirellulales bacterium]
GYRFLLPIKCGPDTCFAERLPLPYWHDSLVPAWSQNGARIAESDQPWYGGPYREGLRSGVGPYALTRLAMETGGTFTLLDHSGLGGPFNFENMQRYLPSYASAQEYLYDLKYYPLRQAVLDVVQLLSREQAKIYLPKFSFVSTRGKEYPFKTRRIYMTPGEFRTELRDDFDGQVRHLAMAQEVLETAIARFGPTGMESEFEKETSPRWRAWYDVTRGRLLAMSLRHSEYVATCQAVLANAGMLSADTNHIVFHPSTTLKVGNSMAVNRGEEAKRLLLRCMEQNPQTPWAYLAQWELDRPLGLDVEQVVIPPPQPRPAGPAAPAGGGGGMPSLPNL